MSGHRRWGDLRIRRVLRRVPSAAPPIIWRRNSSLRFGPIHLGLGDGPLVGRAASREPGAGPKYTRRARITLLAYAPDAGALRFPCQPLAVPLLREDRIIGGLVVPVENLPASFAPEVIELLKTFATQSVLAIQNARLFREIEDKSRQIEAANRHKSEFLANMSHELERRSTPSLASLKSWARNVRRAKRKASRIHRRHPDLRPPSYLLSMRSSISPGLGWTYGTRAGYVRSPLGHPHAPTFVRERATKHGINLDVTLQLTSALGISWVTRGRLNRFFSTCFPTR